jgi:peptidyl-prolyl cis-trans isomerase D
MLTGLKKFMLSTVGKVILFFSVVAMALGFGFNDIFNGNFGGALVQAGDRALTADTLDRRVENLLRNLNTNGQRPISKPEAVEQGLVDQVFALEYSKAANMGYAAIIGAVASDDSVIEELQAQPAFANPLTGEFDRNTYQEVLNRNQLRPAMYQEQIRDDLTLEVLRKASSNAIYTPKVLENLQASYIGETRDFSYFFLQQSAVPEIAAPTDEELNAYYTENLAVFKQPERRSIDLLKISAEDFISEVEVTDDEVSKVYEATKAQRFSEPDTRSWTKMTFANRETARTAFGLLAGGQDPSALTNVVASVDASGRQADIADELLSNAMFGPGKEPGALFGPRENSDGTWDVWRLADVQAGAVYPLAIVSDVIRQELARERAELLFFDAMTDLDSAVGAGLPLGDIAQEIGVPLLSFLPVDVNGFTKSGAPLSVLTNSQDAFTSAFKYPVGELGDRFDGESAIYLASTAKIIPEATPAFETIREDVERAYLISKSSESLQAYADTLIEQVKSGEIAFEGAAAAVEATVTRPEAPVSRLTAQQSGLPQAAISGVFSGREGDVQSYSTRLGDQILLVKLDSISRPTEEELAVLSESASTSLAQSLEQDLQAALESEIGKSVKVKSNPAALNAYKTSITSQQ